MWIGDKTLPWVADTLLPELIEDFPDYTPEQLNECLELTINAAREATIILIIKGNELKQNKEETEVYLDTGTKVGISNSKAKNSKTLRRTGREARSESILSRDSKRLVRHAIMSIQKSDRTTCLSEMRAAFPTYSKRLLKEIYDTVVETLRVVAEIFTLPSHVSVDLERYKGEPKVPLDLDTVKKMRGKSWRDPKPGRVETSIEDD